MNRLKQAAILSVLSLSGCTVLADPLATSVVAAMRPEVEPVALAAGLTQDEIDRLMERLEFLLRVKILDAVEKLRGAGR